MIEQQHQGLRTFNERRPASPEYNDAADRNARDRTRQPIPASQARAGVTGHNVRYVLVFSAIAAVAGFLIAYLNYV